MGCLDHQKNLWELPARDGGLTIKKLRFRHQHIVAQWWKHPDIVMKNWGGVWPPNMVTYQQSTCWGITYGFDLRRSPRLFRPHEPQYGPCLWVDPLKSKNNLPCFRSDHGKANKKL
jgi:hypothetical protein